MTGVVASGIAILIAIALFVILSMKGFPQLPVVLLCVAVVAITVDAPWAVTFVEALSRGAVTTFESSALVFITGGALGGIMAVTGCGKSMGRFVVKHAGRMSGPFLCMILDILLGLSGMATSIFITVAVCSAVAEAFDQPLYVYMTAVCGPGTLVVFGLPGMPGVPNLAPTTYLGTSIYSGATVGLICVALGLILNFAYIIFVMKRADRLGDHFVPTPFCNDSEIANDADLPKLWFAVSPIIIVVAGCWILTNVVGVESTDSVVICQLLATIWVLVWRWKYLGKGKGVKAVAEGMQNSFPLLIGCAFLTGFGAVIQSTAACRTIIDGVLNMNLSPYVLALVAMLIIAALTSDGVGAEFLLGSTIGEQLLASGANAGVLHRIISISATVTDSLPQSSMVYMNLNVFGYTHKQGYKYLFVVTVMIPLVCSLMATALGCIFY